MRHCRLSLSFATAAACAALATQAAAQMASTAPPSGESVPDPGSRPIYATIRLDGGFQVDPFPIGVIAGGSYSASDLGTDCIGNINPERADARVEFANGRRPLSIYAAAGSDVALVVHTPSGRWICADDTTDGGINPAITFDRPTDGAYAVWVAAVDASSRPVPAVLVISEFPPTW